MRTHPASGRFAILSFIQGGAASTSRAGARQLGPEVTARATRSDDYDAHYGLLA
jgi:hypothetical protein